MAADRARKGVKPATSFPWLPAITKLAYGWRSVLPTMASSIRAWIDRNVPATWAGTSMGQNLKAVRAMYGVVMTYVYGAAWTLFVSYVLAHRGAAVSIMYSVVHAAYGGAYDGCRSFDGRHAIYVNERRLHSWTDSAGVSHSRYEFLVFDPLADHRYSWIPQGPQWWPADLLKKAMLAANGGASVEFDATPATA